MARCSHSNCQRSCARAVRLQLVTPLSGVLGAGSIGVAALLTLLISASYLASPAAGNAYAQHLWTWMSSGGFQPEIAFYLDPVSLLMLLVVTFVGFLIHLYSVEYMRDDEGYARFFAYMNLFVASMLMLVLANNLLLLYLGWEGVGLCSFLLIGFWYRRAAECARCGQSLHRDALRRYRLCRRTVPTVHALGNIGYSGS